MTDVILICGACAVGLLEECRNPKPGHAAGWIVPCVSQMAQSQGAERVVEVRQAHQAGGRLMEPDELSDDTSAGRKRAAMLAPIMNGMACEWAGLLYAGGGVKPILGCLGNRIAKAKSNEEARVLGADEVGHIHHGPDKAVLNNAVGVNLHRVCSRCHNRWHALNDEFYSVSRPHVSRAWTPDVAYFEHDKTDYATSEQYAISEEWWAMSKADRPPYPFTPTHLQLHVPSSTVATVNPFETAAAETGDQQ